MVSTETNGTALRAAPRSSNVDGGGAVRFAWSGEDGMAEDLSRRLEDAWNDLVGAVHELRSEVKHGLQGVQRQLDEHARETIRRLDEHSRELYGTSASDPGLKIRTDRIERSVGQLLWLGSVVGVAVLGVLLSIYVPACERIMHERQTSNGASAP